MAEVTTSMIKDLRERTGAGMADCKKALQETEADIEKAIDFLRKKGLAKAAKKAGREATEGSVVSYIHGGGRIGVLVEVNCETDFVARNEEFRQLCKDIAVHILGTNPKYVRREDMPGDLLDQQKTALLAEVANKPEEIREKIVEGKLSRWAAENSVLLDQPFVKDDSKTIRQLIQEVNARTGENIAIARFARFVVGESASSG